MRIKVNGEDDPGNRGSYFLLDFIVDINMIYNSEPVDAEGGCFLTLLIACGSFKLYRGLIFIDHISHKFTLILGQIRVTFVEAMKRD